MAKKPKPEDITVPPIDLDHILGKPKNRISRIGLELEGGWSSPPPGTKVDRDGSVFKNAGDDGGVTRTKHPNHLCGEMPIGPMQPGQINRALKKYYPDLTDLSCGLHVHMSFDTLLQYLILADSPAYQETIIEYLGRWAKKEDLPEDHPIWERLTGKSEYCQKKFWPQDQMNTNRKDHDKLRYGHRYTMVHYCWGRFGTVEIRILPMLSTPELAGRAVRTIIDVTNAYLVVGEKAKLKERGELIMNLSGSRISMELKKGEIYEEYTES